MTDRHIFSDNIEQGALDQFEAAMTLDFSIKGALMPDAHRGYALPIGGVVATEGMIMPAWVGYDIGCGMCAIRTDFIKADVEANANAIFKALYEAIPVGYNHHQNAQFNPYSFDHCSEDLKRLYVKLNGDHQLGTLGGGNHFIEIGYDEDNYVWIIIHSGSRGFGWNVAKHYMSDDHSGFRVESDQGQAYITDMNYCLAYALENREQIQDRVFKVISEAVNDIVFFDHANFINRNHNHAVERDGMWIHRKGATHAEEGMMGVIPGNMRDGSFIVRGLGNPDALWSSSHGAGRVLGRRAARKKLDVDEFIDGMKGITAKVGKRTLDESPLAYKNIFEVMELQANLVEVITHVKPIINIKG